MTAIRVERGGAALSLLDERWDELVLRQRVPNPTLTTTWLRALAAREPGVPLIVAVEAGDELLGAGAFAIRRPLGPRGPEIASWLGDSPILTSPELLVDRRAPEAPGLIAGALLGEARAIHLGLAATGGPLAEGLLLQAPWLSLWWREEGWVAPLPPATLKRRQRQASYDRRRAERAGADVTVSVFQDPPEVGAALERLFTLHDLRWRGRIDELPRFAATGELRDWYRAAVAAMAERSAVRMVEVREDDEPVASLLGLLAGRGALAHTWAVLRGGRLVGAGHHTMLAFAEAAFATGATVLDLGRGSGHPGGPKADLQPSRAPVAGIFAARSWPAQQLMEVPLAIAARARRISERHGRVP